MSAEHKIDCEPEWTKLIDLFLSDNFDKKVAKEELMKLAKLGDIVRQAQKQNKILKCFPDGKIIEVPQ